MKNVMMKNDSMEYVWNSLIPRNKIYTIRFYKNMNDVPENAWDVSEDKDGSVMAWLSTNRKYISTRYNGLFRLHIAANGRIILNNDSSYLFSNFTSCVNIGGLTNVNTSKVEDMSYMFYNCCSMPAISLYSFSTNNVKNMKAMFSDCILLEKMTMGTFQTRNVEDMSYMFSGCDFKKLDLKFVTCRVRNMSHMFEFCTELKELDISSFNTENVTDMSYMFAETYDLQKVNILKFNTTKVTNMSGMFTGCLSLTDIDLSHFKTKRLNNISKMFQGCECLRKLTLFNIKDRPIIRTKMFDMCGHIDNIIYC